MLFDTVDHGLSAVYSFYDPGFIKHGLKYLSIFVPKGVPVVLLPLITIIEIISYIMLNILKCWIRLIKLMILQMANALI